MDKLNIILDAKLKEKLRNLFLFLKLKYTIKPPKAVDNPANSEIINEIIPQLRLK